MNVSWGFIWQHKDESQHAVPDNWGPVSIELGCRIQRIVMAGIAGSPDLDSYWYSQKVPFLNWSFHHDVNFRNSADRTLPEIRYHIFMIWHEHLAFKICGGRDLASNQLICWAQIPIRIVISSSSLNGNQLTSCIIRYGLVAARTDQIVKMLLCLHQKHCECKPVRGSVVYRWEGVAGSSRVAEQKQSLKFSLSSCSSIMEPEWH